MERIPSSKAAKILGELCERAAKGERILLTRYGRPYVLISPPPEDLAEDQEQEEVAQPT